MSHTSSEEVNFEDEVQFPAGAEEAGTLSNSAAPCLNPAELTGNVSGKVSGNMSGNMSGNASGDGSDGLTGNESGGENQQPYQAPLSAGGERIQDSTSLLQPLLQEQRTDCMQREGILLISSLVWTLGLQITDP